jgi:glycosyltransferase involved in cell wall biosynthesis
MLTIFTPAYNRNYTLKRLYKSLLKQTNRDFEWLIVDDGSSDNTPNIIEKWQKENNVFSIIYIKQENGGKHRAINTGLKNAKGNFFFIVDSDDFIAQDAVETVARISSIIDEYPNFAGICGLRADVSGAPLGNSGRLTSIIDISMIDIRQKYKIRGDMAEVFKTDILKRYPFPEFEGEKFISEAAVWNKISEQYILRYIPKVLYYCQYLPDGLTKSIRMRHRNSPMGTMYLYKGILLSPLFSLKNKFRAAILYWRYLLTYKKAYFNCPPFYFFFWPIGAVFYFLDLFKFKQRESKNY